ncbi:MAG TPA: phospholipase A [Burkholderiaceae bacterium]|nr:phospholipase A [Burkholderiaceae bacterium]
MQRRNAFLHRTIVALAGALTSSAATAAGELADIKACAKLVDRDRRLACFDELAARASATDTTSDVSSSTPPASGAATTPDVFRPRAPGGSRLSRLWELEPEDRREPLTFRPHRDNYVLFANYSRDPNSEPYRPFRAIDPDVELTNVELAFQLGFKMKLVEQAMASPFDLWFGYTQRSFWQAYNSGSSSPFRESNYEPELMAVAPLDLQLLGWRARLINIGLVHQSNGQAALLSRSWNRIYAQVGLERGDFSVLARVWKPVASLEGNEDIEDFFGHGDVYGTYRLGGHEFSLLARANWRTGHGALQASWAFPFTSNIKGYVQLFSGYGDSLINYNVRQQTFGFGVLVAP